MIPIKEGKLRSVFAIESEDKEIPDGAIVVGMNGQFEASSSPVFSFIKPIGKDSTLGLKHITPGFTMKNPIPWDDFWIGAQWLRNQWDKHCQGKGQHASKEFILLLFYNQENDKYFWHPPKQNGQSMSLDYTTSDDDEIIKLISDGSLIVGTMHNHFGKGTAFQSGTDHKDEAKHGIPMIHFTMAYMDAPHLYMSEFDVRFVAGEDFKKKLDFSDVVNDCDEFAPPEDWDDKIKVKYNAPARFPLVMGSRSVGPVGNRTFITPQNRSVVGVYDADDDGLDNGYEWWREYHSQLDSLVDKPLKEWDDVDSVEIGAIDELALTNKTILSGFSGFGVKDLTKKYSNAAGIGGSKELFMCKAIIFALFQDFKAMVMTDDGICLDTMDKGEMFEIITDAMSAISKADDMLEEFVRTQDALCSKKT